MKRIQGLAIIVAALTTGVANAQPVPAGEAHEGVQAAPELPAGHPPIEAAPADPHADPHAGMNNDPHAGMAGDPHSGMNNDPDGVGGQPAGEGHMAAPSGDPHATGMERLPNFRQVQLAEAGATEAADLPAGVILVRVVNALGEPVPDVLVRVGSMREGERQAAREVRTRADGVAQFDHLDTGTNVAYRVSTENAGAKFSATPFQLPSNAGYRVQLVRFDVDSQPHSILISDARVEIAFQDDRLVVVQRMNVVNFSSMSLRGEPPHPVAFVPPAPGLRFRLPEGFSVFRADEQNMGDQRLTEENGYAVLHGSIPPTGMTETIPLVFQYRVKLTGTEVAFNLTMPLPVLRATVVTQAPTGLRLEVEGMQPAEERTNNNQRILLTGRERQSREDAPIEQLHIRLAGIPPSAGPERNVAAVLAMTLAFGSVIFGVRNSRGAGGRGARGRKDLAALKAERERLLAEAAELSRSRAAGDIGPETYARRHRELTIALAGVLKAIAESKEPTAPVVAHA